MANTGPVDSAADVATASAASKGIVRLSIEILPFGEKATIVRAFIKPNAGRQIELNVWIVAIDKTYRIVANDRRFA